MSFLVTVLLRLKKQDSKEYKKNVERKLIRNLVFISILLKNVKLFLDA